MVLDLGSDGGITPPKIPDLLGGQLIGNLSKSLNLDSKFLTIGIAIVIIIIIFVAIKGIS